MQASDAQAPREGPAADPLARGLLALALLVACLRFWKLDRWSLWYDEAATWFDLHGSLEDGEIHHTLGYRLIGWTVELCGGVASEWNLRLLPALAGALVVPATWLAFARFAGRRRAAAAALLVAASSWHVYWSQNARFYTLAQLVALLGGALVLRGLWQGRVLQALGGFALAGLAGLLHPSALLLVPALALAPWLLAPLRLEPLRSARKPTLVLAAACLIGLLANLGWIRSTWETYLRQAPDVTPGHYLLTTGYYVTPLCATAALLGVVVAWRRRSAEGLFVASVVLTVLVLVLLASLRVRIAAQYVFVLLPWIALLAAWPLEPRSEGRPARVAPLELGWMALLVAPQLASCALYFSVRKGERPQWKEAYEFVWNRRGEADLVLGMEASVGEFTLDPLKLDLRNAERVAWLDRWRAHLPREWAAHARRAWFVFNPEQLEGWEPADKADFQRFLREQCRLVKCFPLYVESRDLSVWVYLRG